MPTHDKPAKRVRTDAQLAQKRQSDRLKHKLNRAENKTRLENIERDVSFLRETVGGLLGHLQSTDIQYEDRKPLLQRYQDPNDADSFHGGLLNEQQHYHCSSIASLPLMHSTPPASSSASLSLSPPAPPDAILGAASPQTPLVDCRCGLQHGNAFECVELNSFTMLYEFHKALSQTPQLARSMPRNPSLPALLLQNVDENPLTRVIGTTLRQFETRDIETLVGIYFLVYRLLRWRAYPDSQRYDDVPYLMRPTSVQNTEPHPLSVDFLPWPTLRDYLCLNQNKDPRHSVDLYVKSLQLKWPAHERLLQRGSSGIVELNPNFESVVSDIGSWKLTSPWADAFPQLLQFTLCD